MRNLFAYTAPGAFYPASVSLNRVDEGVELTVRGEATIDGQEGPTISVRMPAYIGSAFRTGLRGGPTLEEVRSAFADNSQRCIVISDDKSADISTSETLHFSFSIERIENGFVVRDMASGCARHASHDFEIMRAVEQLFRERIAAELGA